MVSELEGRPSSPLNETLRMQECYAWAAEFAATSKLFDPPANTDRYAKIEPITPGAKAKILRDLAMDVFKAGSYKSNPEVTINVDDDIPAF